MSCFEGGFREIKETSSNGVRRGMAPSGQGATGSIAGMMRYRERPKKPSKKKINKIREIICFVFQKDRSVESGMVSVAER